MNDIAQRARYAARLARVLDHIYDHLDEPLDIDRLAEIACLSPYHWHRIYHAMYGESVATTVRRLRLHRAAGFLANGAMPIPEIAERSGYKQPAGLYADLQCRLRHAARAISESRNAHAFPAVSCQPGRT